MDLLIGRLRGGRPNKLQNSNDPVKELKERGVTSSCNSKGAFLQVQSFVFARVFFPCLVLWLGLEKELR